MTNDDEMKFEDDGRVHFEVTRYQRRRTIIYAEIAEFCYVRSMRKGAWMPNTWRRLGDFFTRRIFFFSNGGIPVPKDRDHTNAFREYSGLKPLEHRDDKLNSMTAEWVQRAHLGGEGDQLEDRVEFDRFAESIARKETY